MTTSADSEPDVWSLMRDAPGTLAARGAFSARWVLEPRRGMLRPSAAPLCELGECCERNCSLRRDAPAARELLRDEHFEPALPFGSEPTEAAAAAFLAAGSYVVPWGCTVQ